MEKKENKPIWSKAIIAMGILLCMCIIISQIFFLKLILANINKPSSVISVPATLHFAEEDPEANNNIEIAVPTEELAIKIGFAILKENFDFITDDARVSAIDKSRYEGDNWEVRAVPQQPREGRFLEDSSVYVIIRKKDSKIIAMSEG